MRLLQSRTREGDKKMAAGIMTAEILPTHQSAKSGTDLPQKLIAGGIAEFRRYVIKIGNFERRDTQRFLLRCMITEQQRQMRPHESTGIKVGRAINDGVGFGNAEQLLYGEAIAVLANMQSDTIGQSIHFTVMQNNIGNPVQISAMTVFRGLKNHNQRQII